jgi:hypothetical protein
MAEFLKDCIHELKALDIKNIDFAYIKELEIKVMADLATVKRGERPIHEIRDIIMAEEAHVISFLFRIDEAIREFVKEMNEIQEWQTYEYNPEKDMVEQSIVFGAIGKLHLEETGVQTEGLNITLEEAQKKHALAFYVPVFKEYIEFLIRTKIEIDTVINDPEYWNMRTIAEVDKIRKAPPEPAPKADIPFLTDAECLQRLVDTGYIMINPRITDRMVYLIKRGHTVLDVFDELAKMTGSETRARAIMFQNMSGVKSTLDRHRPKKSLKT